ncbi:tripartite motif-containing protein 60-like [Peromyscus californicus insignis]|uniref:tripartite motif-containing protein 60-like n=1 Tax=Peromyscus californicus insignis TaxID=564181 RepID=UPI0022A6DA85|nr:tripartite motif-containing protein 60-like [Peromyscus californicus insignis]
MSSPTTFVQGSEEPEAGRADLQAKAHCPVCKKYFKDPVTIKCGHNFCLTCIREFWKDLKDRFPCPVCHFNCPERSFQSNEQLTKKTKVAKPLPVKKTKKRKLEEKFSCETRQKLPDQEVPATSWEKDQEVPATSCEKDQEVPATSWEKDQEVPCPQRSLVPSHTGDSVWPIEKAALSPREYIECYVKLWREKVEPEEKTLASQRRRLLELKKWAERRGEELALEYQQYRSFLRGERENMREQLQNEETAEMAKLQENLAKFSDHIASLKCLWRKVKSKYVRPELELLTGLKDCYERPDSFRCPDILSFTLKEYGFRFPPQCSGLDRIIKRFQVDVLLDPGTAYCKLTVSEDRKAVQYGGRQRLPYSSKRFRRYPIVLGSEGYSSGRQYWEVDVECKNEWVVGVCKESFPRKRPRGSNSTFQQYSVQDGLWGVGLNYWENYFALGREKISLLPSVAPNRVGIFLDSEMHEVSFYNLRDKSLLYSFSDCASGALWPYFYVGYHFTPLKICTVEEPEP